MGRFGFAFAWAMVLLCGVFLVVSLVGLREVQSVD